MEHFAGLDVSVNETSVCTVDETGRIVREVKVASEPDAFVGGTQGRGCEKLRPETYDPPPCPIHAESMRTAKSFYGYRDKVGFRPDVLRLSGRPRLRPLTRSGYHLQGIVSGNRMDRFIARANIRHYRDLLWSERDAATRSQLQKLLVEEEDKLAADLELLADIERHIADGHRRIERQRALVEAMERNGHDGLPKARQLLDGMIDGQILHTMYRERIMISVERNRL